MQSNAKAGGRASSVAAIACDSDDNGSAIAALAERLVRELPSGEDAAFLQRLNARIRADPATFSASFLAPTRISIAELAEWQPLVRAGAFAVTPSGSAAAASVASSTDATARAMGRKRKQSGAASVSGEALAAPPIPAPRLLRALRVLWEYRASIETVDLEECALTPNAMALLCAALSGIDRRNADAGAQHSALRALLITSNDHATAPDEAAATRSGAWHIAQYLRTNASLRRLQLTSFPLSATDLADVCDALLARRDAYGATLERLNISCNPTFERPPSDAPPSLQQEYRLALTRITEFSQLNAATDRVDARAVSAACDGYEHPRRRHFPAALQSLRLYQCGDPFEALTAWRAKGCSALCNGAVQPTDALTGLDAQFDCSLVEGLMAEWVSGVDCTLRALTSSWAPSQWPRTRSPPGLAHVLQRCALYANASLTDLTVTGTASPLTDVEFVALLSSVRTHPALRKLTVYAPFILSETVQSRAAAASRAFTVAIGAFPVPCAALLSRFWWLNDDDPALPASARTQAIAELLAFGADHLEDIKLQGLTGVVNGAYIALAQRWVDDRTRHCDVCDPVRDCLTRDKPQGSETTKSYASAELIRARLSAAPEVARISSLKRLTITCDIAALSALRTALAPPNGVLSQSLEKLEFLCTLHGVGDPANPWAEFGETDAREAAAAFEAGERVTIVQSVAALLRDGLRHNTALTCLRVDDPRLTDTVVIDGLLPLLAPYSVPHITVSGACARPAPNRTLRCVEFAGSRLSAVCLVPIAHIICGAPTHGLRELHLQTHRFGADALNTTVVRALNALRCSGASYFAVDIDDTSDDDAVEDDDDDDFDAGRYHPRDANAGHVKAEMNNLSRELQRRARHARRQWARLAVLALSYRAVRTRSGNGLANSVQPLLPAIMALAAL